MAGEPSLFLIYKTFSTDERNSDSWYSTQALADAAATDGGVGFTAHQGAVEVPEGWETGWIYNPTDDKWRVLGVADLDDLETLKYWARVGHDALLAWREGVIALYPVLRSRAWRQGARVARLRAPVRQPRVPVGALDAGAEDRVGEGVDAGGAQHHDAARSSWRTLGRTRWTRRRARRFGPTPADDASTVDVWLWR